MKLYKRGKTYWFTGMINGTRIRKSTGCSDLRQAKLWLDDMLLAKSIKSKKVLVEVMADILQDGQQIPIGDAWGIFTVGYRLKRRKATNEAVKGSNWADFVAFIAAKHPQVEYVDQITPEIAEAYMAQMVFDGRYNKVHTYIQYSKLVSRSSENTQLSANTINTAMLHLKSIMTILCKRTKTENPFAGLEPLANDKQPREPFSLEELKLIHKSASPFVKNLFMIGVHTGLRCGDICMLEWDEVDLGSKIIARKMLKTGKTVRIPILPELLVFLGGIGRVGQYVLPDHAEMYQNNPSGVSYRVSQCLMGLGITSTQEVSGRLRKANILGIHSLRHTFCYLAANAGIPITVIQSIVGHTDQSITEMYAAHVNDQDAQRHLQAMPGVFG